jgi:hypothetical protein
MLSLNTIRSRLILLLIASVFITSCCDCHDPPPHLAIRFTGFTAEELSTLYSEDTNFSHKNYLQPGYDSIASLYLPRAGTYFIRSDSFPYNEVVEVLDTKEIKPDNRHRCDCLDVGMVVYAHQGDTSLYTYSKEKYPGDNPLALKK